MNDTPADRPETLADAVVEEFDEYRPAGEFRAISPVIDTSDRARPTLIIHVDHEDAERIAAAVEQFLAARGARTEQAYHGADDVRVLATVG